MDKKKVLVPLVCHGHSRPIVDLFYSLVTPDGFFLISASKDSSTMLRNGETGDWIGTFEGHKGAVWSCCLDNRAMRAASGSADFSAKIWDALTGDELHSFVHKHIVRACAFSESATLLLTGGYEKILRIFDLNRPEAPPKEVDNSPGSIRTVAWLHSDQTILSSSSDSGGVRLWDLRTEKIVRVLETKSPVTSAEVSRDGRYITTADGNSVKFWDANHFGMVKSYSMPSMVESASLEPMMGNKFVAGGEDMWVRLYDFHTGEEIVCNKGHHGPVHCVRFSPGGESYASGSEDGTIRIWQTLNTNHDESESHGVNGPNSKVKLGDDLVRKIEGFQITSDGHAIPGDWHGWRLEDGEIWTFTVRPFSWPMPDHTIQVNYDGFAEDVEVGDELLVDGGMVRFEVIEKFGPDVKCCCTDPGLLLPRANLTFRRQGRLVRERNAMLPTISSKDWLDIDFGISEGVDFIAISFVKSAEVIQHLKSYIAARSRDGDIGVIAKFESVDSLKCLDEIIRSSDGSMVARGDLGAQIPLEQVPSVQQQIVQLCRQLNKPVIVASQLLESMIEYPTPTRAEVADVSEAVKQRADALMLSGESAMGQYPEKALAVLRTVSLRFERWWREEKKYESMNLPDIASSFKDGVSEEICNSAAKLANKLEVDAIFVYTKTGHMATLLSRCRPDCPIFAFTSSTTIRRRLNLQWGLIPFRLNFSEDMESNLNRTFALLKARGMIKPGDLVIAVSDMLQSIQVMNVPQ